MEKLPVAPLRKEWNPDRWRYVMQKARYLILGKEADKGLIFKAFIYLLLFDTAFIYLKPLFHMVSNMIKDGTDLLDPSVIWVPRTIYLGSLQEAWQALDYSKAFLTSTFLAGSVAVFQTIFCAVAGYAFARLQFPFKRTLFACLLLSFVVPPQVLILPMIITANKLHILNTYWPIILPAMLGHGLKGALFVIIYRQFFSTQPKELEEAATIDGARVIKVFCRVMLPLAKPAIIVVFLFSFVWSWNDFYYPSMYLFQTDNPPLSLSISRIASYMTQKAAEEGPSIFDTPMKMATSFLMIVPLLVLYSFTQRWFVEGVERTGLVE
jgi:multiple sugar transport system permease protein